MKSALTAIIGISMIFQFSALGENPAPVELVGDTIMQPGSTLEFRFQDRMVNPDQLGPSEQSPITFDPPLNGTFTWLSTTSGVFSPAGPLPLGTTWIAMANKPWILPDGKHWIATYSKPLTTPDFGLTNIQSGVWNAEEVSPTPEVRLAFLAPVSADAAATAFRFVNADGVSVAANVRHATTADYFQIPPNANDWATRWAMLTNPGTPIANPDEDTDSAQPLPARLIITPVQPLSPGDGWTLQAEAGLVSEDEAYRTSTPIHIPLGTVQPLRILTTLPDHFINSGTALTVNFNRPLAPDIDEQSAAQFFSVEPPVEGLSYSVDWQQLVIRGDFLVGKTYTLRVGDRVVAADGLPFDGDRDVPFQFGPVAPRVYLPEITGDQLRFGRREFPIRFINLSKLTLTATRVPLQNLPQAMEAFTKYQKADWDEDHPDEVYQPVSMDAIAGEVIFTGDLDIGNLATDEAGTVVVDWTKILGGETPGAVFLTVSGEPRDGMGTSKPGSQALIQITDLGVLWKFSTKGLDVTTFSLKSGEPVAKAEVILQDSENVEITRVLTDAQGSATIPVDRVPGWLTVSYDSDGLAMRMGPDARELPVWSFGLPVSYQSWEQSATPDPDARGIVFTDRPVYRPGEVVHIKGIIRKIQHGAPAQANGLTGRFMVFGPRGEPVEAQNVVLGDDGTFSAEITASSARRGAYRIGFRLGDKDFPSWQAMAEATFLIADYQPDAFEIHLDLPTTLAAGAPVPEPMVSGKYFFGAPISGATMRWTLQVTPSGFSPDGFDGFDFLPSQSDQPGTLTRRGEAVMKSDRPIGIPLDLPADIPSPTTNHLTVEVTDENQQTVTAEQTFKRNSSEMYLGIAPFESHVLKSGGTAQARVVAVLPNGSPAPEPVPFSAKLLRLKNNVVRIKGAGNAISFQTTTVREPVAAQSGLTVTPKRVGAIWSVADTDALEFPLSEPGAYVLQVSTTDAGGRPVISESTFYVAGKGETVWDYRNPSQIDLIADQDTYHPGDTARIMVKNPISGEAIVSVEQGASIRRTFSITLEGNAPVIEIPIEQSDSPNVFVSLMVFRGSDASKRKFPMPEFRYGLCNLTVTNPADALRVEISPSKSTWIPGETASVDITVNDHLGKPVPGASVTFFAVDDGVLALTGYTRPDPLSEFQQPNPLAVRTGLTLVSLLPENPADLSFSNKGYLIGGGGVGGPGLKFRDQFPGTICWMPNLKSDASGRVQVEFPVPDALTRYRLVAVVNDGVSRFGSSESSITISKPLMLLSGLGSFANVGDTLTARAVVRNQTGANCEVNIRLGVSAGVKILSPAPPSIAVPDGGSVTVDVPVEFTKTGAARLEWIAESQSASDALAVTVSVGSPMVQLRETYLPTLDQSKNDLLKGINPQLVEGTGTVQVTVANTRLAGIGDGAAYLLDYPFGCAEQTVSAMIPWLVNGLAPVIPALEKSAADRKSAITTGADRLISMQKESGGITFWPGARQPSLFASAWAGVALAKFRDVGLTAPIDASAALNRFLSESLRDEIIPSHPDALNDRALTLYALGLAGRAEPAYHEAMLQISGSLSEEARCWLAMAMARTGGENATAAARELLQSRAASTDAFSPFGSAARQLAVRLLATVEIDPKSNTIPVMVAELLKLRTHGHWGNTQANAWALLAMEAYYTTVESAGTNPIKSVSGKILDGQSDHPFTVTKSSPVTEITMPFPGKANSPELVVTNPKKGNLFGQTTFVIFPPLGVQPRQDRGFSVSRSYQKVSTDGTLLPAEDLRVGDRVMVSLQVESSRPAWFVAIDDPLPSILEAVNPDFVSKSTSVQAPSAPVDFREVLNDRVRFFSDNLPAGTFTYHYLARVRNAGEATGAATKVEAMYQPDRFGLGNSQRLISNPAR